jgi:translation elongation factor EF-4
MEVFNERLENEFGQSVVVTAPNLPYLIKLKKELIKSLHTEDEITILNPCLVCKNLLYPLFKLKKCKN